MMQTFEISRRTACLALVAVAATAVTGCGRSPADDAGASDDAAEVGPQAASMTVYRDPNCGCCEEWAEVAREAGYRVSVTDHPDMAAIKRQYGVPDALVSCHTTVVGGYAIEGHVPLEHVRLLLETRPAGITGIAVAGMPRGSPGMEMPDGSRDPFEVMAFDRAGRATRFEVQG